MKPLVCKTPQVKAFLDGATQFRMPVKPQPVIRNAQDGTRYLFHKGKPVFDDQPIETAPYQPGDVLYAKETWKYAYKGFVLNAIDYLADFPENKIKLCKWKPSVHMPREYARILLLVKDVRVERVQDTNIGLQNLRYLGIIENNDVATSVFKAKEKFISFWNFLYPKYPYDSNPYTWVYDVERIEK